MTGLKMSYVHSMSQEVPVHNIYKLVMSKASTNFLSLQCHRLKEYIFFAFLHFG